ncbi:MAG: STAS domain-containing protein [Candidatus Binatia bacterium]
MTSRIEHTADISVITPVGRIDGTTAASIEKEILDVIAAGSPRVVLDLSQIEYISSAGLRVVVIAAKRLKQRSGSFVLCSLQPLVSEVFEISGLLSLVTVKDSLREAMATAGRLA